MRIFVSSLFADFWVTLLAVPVINSQKIKKVLKIVILSLLYLGSFAFGFVGSYLFLRGSDIFIKTTSTDENVSIKDTELPQEAFTVLLLGYGGAGHDGGNLSDVIMVAHINTKEKEISFISIPRDLWVEIPVRSDKKEYYKVNAAYAIGSDDKGFPLKEPQYKGEGGAATLSKEVVSDVVGMPIDYFIAVDFEGFRKIVDILGGLEVNVPVTFDDYFYPVKGLENETCGILAEQISEFHANYSGFELEKQFISRYEHIHFDKGKNHIDGETALKYVRSRHSDQHGGDFARSQRQQALLIGLRDKFISLDALKNTDQLFNQISSMIRTDLDLATIKKLLELDGNIKDYKVSFIGLNDQNTLVASKSGDGQFILIPKEGQGEYVGIQKFIRIELAK